MTTPEAVYPFATQDGKAIPFDILKPSSLIIRSFTSAAVETLTLATDVQVANFLATQDCLVSFEDSLAVITVTGTVYPKTLIVPAGIVVASVCASTNVYVRGLSASGNLFIQTVEKWSGLALEKQYGRK